MTKAEKETGRPVEKGIENALRAAGEHLRTLVVGGRWGHVTVQVQAGRIKFVERFEREDIQ